MSFYLIFPKCLIQKCVPQPAHAFWGKKSKVIVLPPGIQLALRKCLDHGLLGYLSQVLSLAGVTTNKALLSQQKHLVYGSQAGGFIELHMSFIKKKNNLQSHSYSVLMAF